MNDIIALIRTHYPKTFPVKVKGIRIMVNV